MAASRRPIESLARLNRQAHERAFSIEDIDWSQSVDHEKAWIPESLELLAWAPSYCLLDVATRRRSNQLYALGVCELFIVFEQSVIRALPAVLARRDLPAVLRETLECFVVEESKHIEMFWRLLETSEPHLYAKRSMHFASVSQAECLFMRRATRHPDLFLAWIWLTIFLEERTLFVSRQYMKAERAKPGVIDSLHANVHAFHFMDEVRHCQIDQHLISTLYEPQPRWRKWLCAIMHRRALRGFVNPGRTARRVLARLGAEFPQLRACIIPALLAELPRIGERSDFRTLHFGARALPRNLELLSRYPEHAAALRLLTTTGMEPGIAA